MRPTVGVTVWGQVCQAFEFIDQLVRRPTARVVGPRMVTTDSDYDRFPGLRWQHPLRPGQ